MIPDRFRRHFPCLAALTLCFVGGAVYLVVYGWGAQPGPDTESYRAFSPHRTFGYPLVLAAARGLGLMPVLGAIQLAALFFSALFAWNRIRTGAQPWHWLVLLAIIGNFELIKHCFREMPDALFAAAVLWLVTLVVGAIVDQVPTRASMFWIMISASAVLLLRPAGLPIVVVTALALFAYFGARRMAWAAAGFLLVAVILPSIANWSLRESFSTQQFGGVVAINSAVTTIVGLDEKGLSTEEVRLRRALSPPARMIVETEWPFERAAAIIAVSSYSLHAAFPELATVVDLQMQDARHRNEIAQGLILKSAAMAPFQFLKNYSAMFLATVAAPGFIDAATKSRILALAQHQRDRQPDLYRSVGKHLDTFRLVGAAQLVLMRGAGLVFLALVFLASLGLVRPVIARLTGKASMVSSGPAPYLALIVLAYLLLIGLVTALPRFVLVISPVMIMFLWFVGQRVCEVIKKRSTG